MESLLEQSHNTYPFKLQVFHLFQITKQHDFFLLIKSGDLFISE